MLRKTLEGMEAHPDHFYRSSVFGSIYSSELWLGHIRHLYGQIHTISETLNQDEQIVIQVKQCYVVYPGVQFYSFYSDGKKTKRN